MQWMELIHSLWNLAAGQPPAVLIPMAIAGLVIVNWVFRLCIFTAKVAAFTAMIYGTSVLMPGLMS